MYNRLAMVLLQSGLVEQEDVDRIAGEWGPGETALAEALVLGGQVTEELITEFLAEIYGIDPVYLNETGLDSKNSSLLNESFARENLVVPVRVEDNTLFAAMADPANLYVIDEIKFATGKEVVVYASAPSAVRRALDDVYGQIDALVSVDETLDDYDEDEDFLEQVSSLEGEEFDDEFDLEDDLIGESDAPVIKFVDGMIARAVRSEVSDIHIEPYEKYLRIRYRRDGLCSEVYKINPQMQNPILSRLKIMSGMNIAERRRTQDGRIKAKVDNRIIDFRVNSVPGIDGEKIVLRILDRGNLQLDLRDLGFPEDALKAFLAGVNSPFGIVLVTGPTGSGKTTTLYSALSSLNTPAVNIHTAEDPVEYNIDGLVQTQIDFSMGYDFAAALKAILRQDPNIIMVGEIRDFETASIAIKAALTGQLVFSTIHTNDAPGTINRLVDIGIKPFLVSSAIRTIMAQRLVKTICKKCKEPYTWKDSELQEVGIDPAEMSGIKTMRGRGCKYCGGSGTKGRKGIYEVLTLNRELKQAVINRVSSTELRLLAVKNGMRTLRMDAVAKFKKGMITLEEVARVTADDEEDVKIAAMNCKLEKQISSISP
ncbi:MAG: Flp pilus assembly complex ATPase component TadA [Candidatus Fermentibacteraceae bacterium]|nr:Flp pilus assembly complex ATPase component TadA [Candidatus Fermentibacteraceae bacterium]